MFKLRNPALGSQEIPETRRCIWTVTYKGQYPLAFAPTETRLLHKLRAVKQNFLFKKKNIYPFNELIFKIKMTLQRCLLLHSTNDLKLKLTVKKTRAHGSALGV